MNRTSTLFAILGVVGCLLGAPATAQDRHEQDRGGREGRGGGYDRGPQGRPAPAPERREPGGYGFGYGYPPPRVTSPPPYAPPRYPAPPPRRPNEPGGGWSQDREAAPGLFGGRNASLTGVIETIRRRMPGRELDAVVEMMDGRPTYRVLWITARGRRMDYVVDAETGAILSER